MQIRLLLEQTVGYRLSIGSPPSAVGWSLLRKPSCCTSWAGQAYGYRLSGLATILFHSVWLDYQALLSQARAGPVTMMLPTRRQQQAGLQILCSALARQPWMENEIATSSKVRDRILVTEAPEHSAANSAIQWAPLQCIIHAPWPPTAVCMSELRFHFPSFWHAATSCPTHWGAASCIGPLIDISRTNKNNSFWDGDFGGVVFSFSIPGLPTTKLTEKKVPR